MFVVAIFVVDSFERFRAGKGTRSFLIWMLEVFLDFELLLVGASRDSGLYIKMSSKN